MWFVPALKKWIRRRLGTSLGEEGSVLNVQTIVAFSHSSGGWVRSEGGVGWDRHITCWDLICGLLPIGGDFDVVELNIWMFLLDPFEERRWRRECYD